MNKKICRFMLKFVWSAHYGSQDAGEICSDTAAEEHGPENNP